MQSRLLAPAYRDLLVRLLLAVVLILGLGRCQVNSRAATPPAPHPYLPLEPGSAWALQLTHWEYPSRFEAMPLVFSRDEFFRIVSAGPEPGGFTIRTDPGVASLLFLSGLGLPPAELVQDSRGFWLRGPGKKKDPGLLWLPASPGPGQTWSALTPAGIEVRFRVLALGEPFSAGTAIQAADALGLEIVFTSEGQDERRVLWLGRELGPLSVEAYAGPRLTDRWLRTDLDPFIRQP